MWLKYSLMGLHIDAMKLNNMKKSPIEFINLSFSALMVVLTVAGAFTFYFTDLMEDRVFGNKRYILGTIFLAYAIYRSYRMYKAYRAQ